jgi:hypothetical protein
MSEQRWEILAGGWEDGRVAVKVQVDGRDVAVIEERERGVRPELETLDASALPPAEFERAVADAWESYEDWSGEEARAILEAGE